MRHYLLSWILSHLLDLCFNVSKVTLAWGVVRWCCFFIKEGQVSEVNSDSLFVFVIIPSCRGISECLHCFRSSCRHGQISPHLIQTQTQEDTDTRCSFWQQQSLTAYNANIVISFFLPFYLLPKHSVECSEKLLVVKKKKWTTWGKGLKLRIAWVCIIVKCENALQTQLKCCNALFLHFSHFSHCTSIKGGTCKRLYQKKKLLQKRPRYESIY